MGHGGKKQKVMLRASSHRGIYYLVFQTWSSESPDDSFYDALTVLDLSTKKVSHQIHCRCTEVASQWNLFPPKNSSQFPFTSDLSKSQLSVPASNSYSPNHWPGHGAAITDVDQWITISCADWWASSSICRDNWHLLVSALKPQWSKLHLVSCCKILHEVSMTCQTHCYFI